jgi:hypothetical protein
MEPNGMTVCDQDKEEIGLNILSDPLYQPFESLRVLAKRLAKAPTEKAFTASRLQGRKPWWRKKLPGTP